jgi:hypothetical protein
MDNDDIVRRLLDETPEPEVSKFETPTPPPMQ